ncbi:MAG: substrate-binding and VWA domain-containing protein [Micromonosporaceae bacterium]
MADDLSYFDHNPGKPTRRRGNGWIIGMVSGAIVIVLLLVIGVRAVLVRALCEQGPIRLHVAAALDIAPTVQRIGQYFNDLNRNVGGHCTQVEVTEDPPDTVATELSGMSTIKGEAPVDGWVPDSSLWVDVVRSSAPGAASVRPTGISIAKSPLVIAVPRKTVSHLTASEHHIGWSTLFPQQLGGPSPLLGLQVQLPDPVHSAVGLATLVQTRRVLGTQQAARDKFTNFVHNVVPTTSFDDPQSLSYFAALAQPPWEAHPITVTTEQAVGLYNQTRPQQALTAFYPSKEYDFDYPFVLTTSSPLKVQAAQQFEQILRSSFAQTYVRDGGFRLPGAQADRAGSQYGIIGSPEPTVALAAPGETNATLQAWKRLNLGSRDLVLDDVSDAMGQPLGTAGQTRLGVLQQAARLGLSLFPDSTEMGVWVYSYRMDGALPYQVMVPVGPLPAQLGLITRRQQLEQFTSTILPRPKALADEYGSILAAFRWMTAHYQPGHVNAVIVLGSGTQTAPHTMSLSEMLSTLRKDYDPRRPVEIITVTAGNQGDMTALQEITAISHGASYTVAQPSDIAQVFFDAIARRICVPNCPTG